MSFALALQNEQARQAAAADAVVQAGRAVNERTGIRGMAAQIGLDTINRVRPGFLEHHIHAMLPDMAAAIEPHWVDGIEAGNPADHLEANTDEVVQSLLTVTDAYVDAATDAKAIAVYRQLRPRAPKRIAEQMPRIAQFIAHHTPS